MNENIKNEILRLKKERGAVIMAHYYVPDEVQELADYIGDSYYLSKTAKALGENVIVLCGVRFMGESAKILCPEKTVLLPDADADCAMAHMVTPEKIAAVRREYDDLAVVCYINSTAEIKACCDVCVTSANAARVVAALPNKNIFFVPDENLGRRVSELLPEKNFIFNDGYCPVHKEITRAAIDKARAENPNAPVAVHPECTPDVLEGADFVGSTSGIISFVGKSEAKEFIVGTEEGVLYALRKNNPDKSFILPNKCQVCADMKKITLEKVAGCLRNMSPAVELDAELRKKAAAPLERMLKLSL